MMIGIGIGLCRGGASAPAAKTVYVAKTGNDSTGTGLAGAPYLTIAKAARCLFCSISA